MKRALIPTITRPDIPNVNGIIYSTEVWKDFIDQLEGIRIPLTTRKDSNWRTTGVPIYEIIGYVSNIIDSHIVVDLLDSVNISESTAKMIDTCIDMINSNSVKAYMEYVAEINHEPDMAYQYIDKIYRIDYFYLGHPDPVVQTTNPLNLMEEK